MTPTSTQGDGPAPSEAYNKQLNVLRMQQSQLLGHILYIVVGVVLTIGFFSGVIFSIRAFRDDYTYSTEAQTPRTRRRPSSLKTWLRRKLLLPALFGGRHVQPLGQYSLPTRGQTVMILGYLVLNVVFLSTAFPQGRTLKAVADRAAHLALVNMPIFFLFAGRNNVLIWVTGWSNKDFQVFHKWIARTTALHAVVHAAGSGSYMTASHNGTARQNMLYNGRAAVAVIAAILCFSVMPLRRKYYEAFLVVHILLAVLFLVFLYHHVGYVSHQYYLYIWVCVGIWSLDRALRLVRLAIFNFSGLHTTKAKLVPGTSTIQLTIYPTIKDVGFVPGAHYYIYFPGRWWCFWESHPFTAVRWRPARQRLAQAPEKVIVALEKISASSSIDAKEAPDSLPGGGSGGDGIAPVKPPPERQVIITTSAHPRALRAKLTFLIHARRGMTGWLLQRILSSPGRTLHHLPCLLEGPYGADRPIPSFPTVLVIAGGVGVSTALPYLQQHLSNPSSTRRFVLIWSVREGAFAEKVLGHEVRVLRSDTLVKIYVTQNREKRNKEKEEGREDWRLPVGVRVRRRRPRIEEIIVREAGMRVAGTPMAVVACGAGGVVDAARRGAVRALEGAAGTGGMGDVVYWEEAYGW